MWISARGSQDYTNQVDPILKNIAGNPVGKVITQAIYGTKHDLLIQPMSEWKGDKKPSACRAVTWPDDRLAAAPKGAGAKDADRRGKRYIGRTDDPDTDDNDERYDADTSGKVSDGSGSKALLYFTPGDWGDKGCFPNGTGTQPDEVLLHEMIHALRMMQGFYNPIPTMETIRSYANEEEFLAIVVGNTYISAKDRTRPLVANHMFHDTLWAPLNTSEGFLDQRDNQQLMKQFQSEWRPTFRELGDLKSMVYNPFRETLKRKL